MPKFCYILMLCFPIGVLGQTTHAVSVSIDQGEPCQNPLGLAVGQNLFNVYPNPANETLTIESDGNEATIRIISLNGDLIHSSSFAKQKLEIDIHWLQEGIYILEYRSGSRSQSQKIKIRR